MNVTARVAAPMGHIIFAPFGDYIMVIGSAVMVGALLWAAVALARPKTVFAE
jgi:hypothetical protein